MASSRVGLGTSGLHAGAIRLLQELFEERKHKREGFTRAGLGGARSRRGLPAQEESLGLAQV